MTLFGYHSPLFLLLIFYPRCVEAYQCHQCNAMTYNYPVTIDTLPSPTEDHCDVVGAMHGCYIHVAWRADGTSEVYYRVDPALTFDSLFTSVQRQLEFSTGKHKTERSIGYSCRLNGTPCNTIEQLKRAIVSTQFPTNKQIEQFDSAIALNTAFDPQQCLQVFNRKLCPKSNLQNCEQCIGIVEYRDKVETCAMCSEKNATANFFEYLTTFSLRERSRWDRITVACQGCDSLNTSYEIQRTLTIKVDFDTFLRSVASSTRLTSWILPVIVFARYVQWWTSILRVN